MSELKPIRLWKRQSLSEMLFQRPREINPEVQKLFKEGRVIYWQKIPDFKILLEIRDAEQKPSD